MEQEIRAEGCESLGNDEQWPVAEKELCQVYDFSNPKIFAFNALSRIIIIGC